MNVHVRDSAVSFKNFWRPDISSNGRFVEPVAAVRNVDPKRRFRVFWSKNIWPTDIWSKKKRVDQLTVSRATACR
jgi:hypothetical protein